MSECLPVNNHLAESYCTVQTGSETTSTGLYVIAFIGGGPNTLYCLERLVTRLHSGSLLIPARSLSVTIYEKTGSFGPGIHSKDQPLTNHLNRTAEQVSLCADITHERLNLEVYTRNIETLYQWAAEKFKLTNNPRYNIAPQQWVDRALVGEALSDTFIGLVTELQNFGVIVTLHASEVINIIPTSNKRYKIICSKAGTEDAPTADFAILCTGHTSNKPEVGTFAYRMMEICGSEPSSFKYVHHIYPIEKITSHVVPPGSVLACFGMGLAAIDCINWLTSGRGGYFIADGNSSKLKYIASGFEPHKIFPISESGLFVRARAHNEKENFEERRHVGIVFNESTFDSLRKNKKIVTPGKHIIEDEVIPLLALEMMMLYYRTLLSSAAVQRIEENIKTQLERHIHDCCLHIAILKIWDIYHCGRLQYEEYMSHVNALLTAPKELCPHLDRTDRMAISRFIKVRLGFEIPSSLINKNDTKFLEEVKLINNEESKWGHHRSILRHVFNWDEVLDPLERLCSESKDLHRTVASWLENDILNASQGNLSNPMKAAVDGAIRDLRSCFRNQVEWGAGGPSGTRELFSKWYRVTNRLAVGTSLDLMRKMHALAEAGILDFSFCRSPVKEIRDGTLYLKLGDRTSFTKVALNAIVHRFNLLLSDSPLYQNLRSQGIVREWSVSDGAESYSPGSLDVDRNSRLIITQNAETLPNMAALGSVVDGPYYYRLALSRPYVSDTILFDADQVIKSVISHWSSLQVSSPDETARSTF